ncbi:hypothetical protein SteCoe_21021 [Stentor coeruleus]|uniref:Uncharacterized protein n=1 Tax=Stentor coeruleus TaxID=5963 RepID=A0A1R2BQI4_9CILI|nr:hypothetical protein SteCoe_21021 [Stentor coeruleus]
MKNEKIVRTAFVRSFSTKTLALSSLGGRNPLKDSGQKSSREASLDSSKSSIRKFEKCLPKLEMEKAFIKPKPSAKSFRSQSSDRAIKAKNEESQSRYCKDSLQEYALLDDIMSKFTLKSIESIRKEYSATIGNEVVYKNFIALLSQLDPVFHQNQLLQFSMSRAREVFHLYLSRPGQVLQTFKTLPKTCESTRISKTILSQCKNNIKSINKDKIKGAANDILEALKLILSIQSKTFKSKVFIPKEPDYLKLKTQEDFTAEDPNFDISITNIATLPSEIEKPSTPINTCASEEPIDNPLKPITNDLTKSSKKKILDQLFLKLKDPTNYNESNTYQTSENIVESQENLENQFSCKISNTKNQESIKIKPSRRSNSSIQNYMKKTKKPSEIPTEFTKPVLKNVKSDLRKREWDELRKRKKEAEERDKKEILDEIKKKQEEEESLKRFLGEKKKNEKAEIMRYKEEEIKEQRRIKELKKMENMMEIMDEVKRNIEKSEMMKNSSKVFDLEDNDV